MRKKVEEILHQLGFQWKTGTIMGLDGMLPTNYPSTVWVQQVSCQQKHVEQKGEDLVQQMTYIIHTLYIHCTYIIHTLWDIN